MNITLILTGADRHSDLTRFYSSINSLNIVEGHSAQLIFVNQGEFAPSLKVKNPSGFDHVEINTDRLPLSIARNIGLQHATGEIISFPDDDCWYSVDVIMQVIQYFEAHPEVDAICTNVYDPIRKKSYGGRPIGTCLKVNYRNLFELPISVGIFVRRHAFETAGFYFDETLGAGTSLGSGEETDLIYRLLKSGAAVNYVGAIQVYHPVPYYQDEDIVKYYRYGLGFGYLNGRIVRNGEWRVLIHLCYVLMRSLGGCVVHLFESKQRRLYWNRMFGLCEGFVRGLRGKFC